MSQPSSEEKSLPASEKKLRDARRKGQMAHSQDFVSACVLAASLGCMAWQLPQTLRRLGETFSLAGELSMMPFEQAMPRMVAEAAAIFIESVGVTLAMVIAAVVLGSMVDTRGPVFSATPLVPSYERIDPVAGFKRMVSLRSVMELAKGLFKLAMVAVAMIVVYRQQLPSIFAAPRCGLACVAETATALFWPISIVAIVAFMVLGMADVGLQRWLHLREMRMTHSEQKRERKDSDGNPQLKQERGRLRRATQSLSSERGIAKATVVIANPDGWMVGLRYQRGVTPVPVVVYRSTYALAADALREAGERKLSVVYRGALADAIARQAPIGTAIPPSAFQQVADALLRARLL